MKKIISLFQRNYDGDRLVRDEVVPGAEWVIAGEGVATRKFDGSCCMVRNGILFKRYELKNGKTAPVTFEAAQGSDSITGDIPGWVIVGPGLEDKWFREAYNNTCMPEDELEDGTYEAIGPHFQSNPERQAKDCLVEHGTVLVDAPRTFVELKEWLKIADMEGVVWHHADGRMVKIKAKDFFKKPRNAAACTETEGKL